MKRTMIIFIIMSFFILLPPLTSQAEQKFPSKPIFIIIGQGPGGSVDQIARSLQPFLSAELKNSVIIQNQVGAGGDAANNFIWKAKPDGYNIIMLNLPSFTNRELIKKQPFKILEMSFIYGISGGDYNVIVVPYNSPIKNFQDLKKAAASEKMLSAGGTPPGSNSWYASILLRETTGIKFKYVPYDSGIEAATAAGGSHVDLSITSITSATQPIENKLIRPIVMFGDNKDPEFPNVPTMVELGFKDVHFSTRMGFAGPPGMPKEIIDIIAKATAKAVLEPKYKVLADRQGFTIDPLTGPEFHRWAVGISAQAKKFLTQAGEIKNK